MQEEEVRETHIPIQLIILDKNDNPEAELDYNMLCKMTVSAMGYAAEAEKIGGYPKGYINAANKHNFFKTKHNATVTTVVTAP